MPDACTSHDHFGIPDLGVQEWDCSQEAAYEVVSGICEMRNCFVYPNERPGLGVDVDEAKAAKYPYQRAFMPLGRRADGSMHVY